MCVLLLLGERGKAAAVSSFRFAVVAESCQGPAAAAAAVAKTAAGDGGAAAAGSSLAVSLRGAPLEQVTLLWAAAPGWEAQATAVTMGADGTANVTLPPGAAQ